MFRLLLMFVFLASSQQGITNPNTAKTASSDSEYCKQLENDLRNRALMEMNAGMDKLLEERPTRRPGSGGANGPVITPSMAPHSVTVQSSRVSGSRTESSVNQEEADVIKIDSSHFYVINGTKLEIFSYDVNGSIIPTSVLNLNEPLKGLLLIGDNALVLSQRYEDSNEGVFRAILINLSADRQQPRVLESHYYEGRNSTVRAIGNSFQIVAHNFRAITDVVMRLRPGEDYFFAPPEEQEILWAHMVARLKTHNERMINGFNFLSLFPNELYSDGNQLVPKPLSADECSRIYDVSLKEISNPIGVTSVVTITPAAESAEISSQWVWGSRPTIYASSSQLILATWIPQKDVTRLHRFKSNLDNKLSYVNSITLPGYINDSFSLSEFEGYLRVMTNSRALSPSARKDESRLYILGDTIDGFGVISTLDIPALGNSISSSRFYGAVGYLATDEKINQLFTLDLSDPIDPKVAGELLLPDNLTYLQDLEDGRLLGIGEASDGQWHVRTSMSIFDVRNFAKPTLTSTSSFGHTNNENPYSLTTDHLSINYDRASNITVIPFYDPPRRECSYEENDDCQWHDSLILVNTSSANELNLYGQIDHPHIEKNDVRTSLPDIRSYLAGDIIYAINKNAITSTKISDLTRISEVILRK